VNNSAPIPLTSFAGCFDKTIGVEYEDCYFSTPRLAAPLLDWVRESLATSNSYRTVTVFQTTPQQPNQAVAQLEITDAFIREFSVGALDTADNDNGTISFVVVPKSIEADGSGNIGNPIGSPTFRMSGFQFFVTGVDESRVTAVSSVRVTWGKTEDEHHGFPHGFQRKLFLPQGPPVTDAIELRFATSSSQTVSEMNGWVEDVAQGDVVARPATIYLLGLDFQTRVLEVNLEGLYPLHFPVFPTFGGQLGQRSIVFNVNAIRMP